MNSQEPRLYQVESNLHNEPEIGRWLWAMEETRKRTDEELDQLSPSIIDWQPPHSESTIGTVLYHIALIEADWLYAEVLEQDYPEAVMALLPHNHRDSHGHLSQVHGIPLLDHRARLNTIRQLLLDVFKSMDLADFRRLRHLPQYNVSPEWVLFHLMQHEAEHRNQIATLRIAAEQALKEL